MPGARDLGALSFTALPERVDAVIATARMGKLSHADLTGAR